jgi:hypothetical protein
MGGGLGRLGPGEDGGGPGKEIEGTRLELRYRQAGDDGQALRSDRHGGPRPVALASEGAQQGGGVDGFLAFVRAIQQQLTPS